MPRKKPRININSIYTSERETPDNTSLFVKYFYRLVFGLLFLYAFTSLFLGPKYFESEVITNVDYKIYQPGRGKFGSGGSKVTDITIYTGPFSKYFISIPPGGRPFQIGDTILIISNLLNQTVGVEKGQYFYQLEKSKGLLVLLTITSLLGLLYTLFGDFRIKFVLYTIVIINSGLLLLYMN